MWDDICVCKCGRYSLMIEEYIHVIFSFNKIAWVHIRLTVSVPLSNHIDFWELHAIGV